MSVKIGEIGKLIYVGTGFDMSANTNLQINFTSPDESIKFSRAATDVTAPATPSPSLPDIGILPANEYLLYATKADDFTVAGNWCVSAVYIEGTAKLYIGDDGTLLVEESCS